MIFSFLLLFWQATFPALPLMSNPGYLSAASLRADSLYGRTGSGLAPVKKDIISLGPEISASSAVVVDKNSGAILYAKNEGAILPLASLTKLLSALVFLENEKDLGRMLALPDLPKYDRDRDFIRGGEQASLSDYLRASLAGSSNSATLALAKTVSADESVLAALLNRKAKAIGMRGSDFVEPTGISSENKGTALDVARLLAAASQSAIIKDITGKIKSEITVWSCRGNFPEGSACPEQLKIRQRRNIINTNQLLYSFVKVIIGKTGYIDESLYNLAAEAELKGEKRIFIVTLASQSSPDRWQDQKALAYWAENAYTWE